MGREVIFHTYLKDVNVFLNFIFPHLPKRIEFPKICVTAHDIGNHRNFSSKLEAEVEK